MAPSSASSPGKECSTRRAYAACSMPTGRPCTRSPSRARRSVRMARRSSGRSRRRGSSTGTLRVGQTQRERRRRGAPPATSTSGAATPVRASWTSSGLRPLPGGALLGERPRDELLDLGRERRPVEQDEHARGRPARAATRRVAPARRVVLARAGRVDEDEGGLAPGACEVRAREVRALGRRRSARGRRWARPPTCAARAPRAPSATRPSRSPTVAGPRQACVASASRPTSSARSWRSWSTRSSAASARSIASWARASMRACVPRARHAAARRSAVSFSARTSSSVTGSSRATRGRTSTPSVSPSHATTVASSALRSVIHLASGRSSGRRTSSASSTSARSVASGSPAATRTSASGMSASRSRA